ncbi:FAD-binding oxidoreductase [Nocardia sp. NPDC051832]|uniref:FAD-binding oxidoreductase n=1 Tax=Nocardia sp. NPDC051832 TaxID=3155673 RepID=UPI0034182631
MTRTSIDLDSLRARLDGALVVPGDAGYDEARRVWNGAIDRRPLAVVRCASAEDVSAAVIFAREVGVEVTVRGGGHHPAGTSVADGALLIDLRGLGGVRVDPGERKAWVGGGALLADLDRATQEYGLAIPSGVVSHTGVGGLTLGGGMGWLTRRAGLSIDHLVAAQVVLADGRIVRADSQTHTELLWALRGGGGNFGVVTEFEFTLHEAGPIVEYAMLFFGLDQLGEMLRVVRELVPELPTDVNVIFGALNAPPAPFVPEAVRLQPGCALMVTGFGGVEQHQEVLDLFRKRLTPVFEMVTPMPYVALQQMIDEPNEHGVYAYEKGTRIAELSDAVIEQFLEHVPRKQSPLSLALCYRLDGAFSAVDDDATAFGGPRAPHYQLFLVGLSPVAEGLAAERDWVRDFWFGLEPHSGLAGSYVNGQVEIDGSELRAIYGAKLDRLAAVKATYDPYNVFHYNANIVPAS